MQTVEDLWRELEGTALEDQIRRHRHSVQPNPVFSGMWTKGDQETPVMVRFWPDEPETGSHLRSASRSGIS